MFYKCNYVCGDLILVVIGKKRMMRLVGCCWRVWEQAIMGKEIVELGIEEEYSAGSLRKLN